MLTRKEPTRSKNSKGWHRTLVEVALQEKNEEPVRWPLEKNPRKL